ncbi:MAG: hypothetical protein KDA87_21985 [Planctomycetales bacterium]|nr:hypothetical protein [Planctomycetales bacterium]
MKKCILSFMLLFALAATASSDESDLDKLLVDDCAIEWNRSEGDGITAIAIRSSQLDEKCVTVLQRHRSLRCLELRLDTPVSTELVDSIFKAALNLHELFLYHKLGEYHSVGMQEFRSLMSLPRLSHLHVENLDLDETSGNTASQFTSVRHLSISGKIGSKVNSLHLPATLQSLSIDATSGEFTASDMSALKKLAALKSLRISSNPQFPPLSLTSSDFAELEQLEKLELANCVLRPGALEELNQLAELRLTRCYISQLSERTVSGLQILRIDQFTKRQMEVAGDFSNFGPAKLIITSPVFSDLEELAECDVDISLRLGVIGDLPMARLHSLGRDKLAMLKKLKSLKRLTVCDCGATVLAFDAITQLSTRLDSLRLPYGTTTISFDQHATIPNTTSKLQNLVFEVDVPKPEYISRLISPRMTTLQLCAPPTVEFQRDWSDVHIKELGLLYTELPFSERSLLDGLFTSSIEKLNLKQCNLGKGAMEQIVSRCPSLTHLAIDGTDNPKEIVLVNRLRHLVALHISGDVSSEIVAKLNVPHVRIERGALSPISIRSEFHYRTEERANNFEEPPSR